MSVRYLLSWTLSMYLSKPSMCSEGLGWIRSCYSGTEGSREMGTKTGAGTQVSCMWVLIKGFWDESFP